MSSEISSGRSTMIEMDQWFLDDLERQRKYRRIVKWFSSVSLFLLGALSGMISKGLCIESKASIRLLIIAVGWSIVVFVFDDWAFRIKLKIKRMEEMID